MRVVRPLHALRPPPRSPALLPASFIPTDRPRLPRRLSRDFTSSPVPFFSATPAPKLAASPPKFFTANQSVRTHRAGGGDKFGPGHHQPHVKKGASVTEEEQARVLERVRGKVDRVLDWARVVVFDGVERAHGRLTPAMLDGIKLATPTGSAALRSIASVTSVPADRALRVEAFDPTTAKAVFAAIRDAGIPGLSASKEEGIVRVEVARPVGDVREGLARNIQEGLESAKHQIRGARAEGLKALGGRGADGTDQVCEVTEGAVGVLDGMWMGVREELKK
ncbi:hypothetical protein CcaverHIS002_0200670 [Cutaneotrichosporon cavernicola]|uniref:Ribosome recycling factor domain-containing protein n=1 Tax=Cutaneotrichosporon cavernicola TaxID=279322 RepID=A0AA48I7W2_9TREE|nr:uncharacterized protein CcaverHIS019_0200720 [Cutaneotrichosporon cavernicola]BEI80907.1 hypothetical protein CcaverHIS002_0200670 [Cutaneotrichosporon cavernicola]BEI88710.1 hypothetical protein CcaverHIS019_0200720 [Cutaneotrichosporon cavernicola]BEI96484.1 hypothetical protein CcaverHIS631_0200730 [Cutaneotrichosporon cavernicola]BEJ04255.1 hypothetical protein CcaverHIS641_0200720 [Cutaneotrichosporon cavernicola]